MIWNSNQFKGKATFLSVALPVIIKQAYLFF